MGTKRKAFLIIICFSVLLMLIMTLSQHATVNVSAQSSITWHTASQEAMQIAAAQNKTFVILQTNCSKDASINRILKRTKENYESNALTEQAYINNLKKFENVDLDDLKNLNPELSIVHLTVDTELDPPEDWHIINMVKR